MWQAVDIQHIPITVLKMEQNYYEMFVCNAYAMNFQVDGILHNIIFVTCNIVLKFKVTFSVTKEDLQISWKILLCGNKSLTARQSGNDARPRTKRSKIEGSKTRSHAIESLIE